MVLDELQEFIPPHTTTHPHTHKQAHEFLGSETQEEQKKKMRCYSSFYFLKKRKTKLFGEAINIRTLICECKAL
jgi:predicted ATPase